MRKHIPKLVILFCCLIALIVLINSNQIVFSDFKETESSQVESEYDLVVYGGDPEGVVAAIAGARNGLKTLLVMEEDGPGGLMVYGALNFLDLNYDERGKVINKGIFKEWHQLAGGEVIVDTEEARKAFMKLLLVEENLTIVPLTSIQEVQISEDQQKISSLIFETTGISRTHDVELMNKVKTDVHPDWASAVKKDDLKATLVKIKPDTVWIVEGKRYIDASQDADLAALADVLYFTGGADVGLPDRKMAVTLVFRLKNVNWKDLQKDIKSQKWGYSKMNSTSAWGLGKIGQKYEPVDPSTRLRGLNIAKQDDGTVFINALQIFNLDFNDSDSLAKGMEQGKKEAEYVVEYLTKELSGFENAELMEFPSQLYVRESRHILTLYQLDILDLVENVDFDDKIAVASYPVDYQATSPVDPGFVIFDPGVYSIPFRSLVPRFKKNILVVGRSGGYGSLAAGSARVIPTGMATAEAAGTAAALSIEEGVDFHKFAMDSNLIDSLQTQLFNQGVDLRQLNEINEVVQDLDYHKFKELFSWGMIVAGYDNDLKLDKNVTEREFSFLLMKGMRLRQADNYDEYLAGGLYSLSSNKTLKRDKACEILLAAGGYWLAKVENVYLTALEDGFIPLDLKENFKTNCLLTRRDMYKLIISFLKRYSVPEDLLELRTRSFGE
ncbi:MAG: FAD-dependent oxidoreductase [Halanaerobiales bacterium]|nr:FAD-dependent oxidoreductase [Halanaerobiales bacterium]